MAAQRMPLLHLCLRRPQTGTRRHRLRRLHPRLPPQRPAHLRPASARTIRILGCLVSHRSAHYRCFMTLGARWERFCGMTSTALRNLHMAADAVTVVRPTSRTRCGACITSGHVLARSLCAGSLPSLRPKATSRCMPCYPSRPLVRIYWPRWRHSRHHQALLSLIMCFSWGCMTNALRLVTKVSSLLCVMQRHSQIRAGPMTQRGRGSNLTVASA